MQDEESKELNYNLVVIIAGLVAFMAWHFWIYYSGGTL